MIAIPASLRICADGRWESVLLRLDSRPRRGGGGGGGGGAIPIETPDGLLSLLVDMLDDPDILLANGGSDDGCPAILEGSSTIASFPGTGGVEESVTAAWFRDEVVEPLRFVRLIGGTGGVLIAAGLAEDSNEGVARGDVCDSCGKDSVD